MRDVKPVRIGVAGAGIIGKMHLKTYCQLAGTGLAEVAGFVSESAERRGEIEKQFGVPGFASVEELLDKGRPEALTIATPDFLRRETALLAASKNLHVMMEKPLDITEDGCREIIDACEKAGVFLQVDFHKRYDPDHRAVYNAVRAGEIGRPLYYYAHMENRIEVPTKWRKRYAETTSPAWFLGMHFLDLIRWITGSEPVKVWASGSRGFLKEQHGLDTWDSVSTRVEFENGCTAVVDASWVLPESFEAVVNQGCRIVGTEGFFETDTQDRGQKSCTTGSGVRTHNNFFFREEQDKNGGVFCAGYGFDSIADFVHNIRYIREHGMENPPGGVWAGGFDGLQATKMVLAAHRSIDEGCIISL